MLPHACRRPLLLRFAIATVLGATLLCAVPTAHARDRGADGRFDRRRSQHFLLLQDVDIDHRSGRNGARRFEKDVLEVLESAYQQVYEEIGLRPRADVEVRVYDPDVFDARFASAFGFRAAGFYNGTIHVRGSTRVHPGLVRTLYHEYVHAALAAEAGPGLVPAWLNEGLAEYFENLALGKRTLSRGERAVLVRVVAQDAWIPLGALSGSSLTHLADAAASVAYLQSYAIVDHLVRAGGNEKLRRFCERLIRVRNLDRALRDTYRLGLFELESAVLEEHG